MADRLIHQRVFKVSKELSRLDLLCEQHRLQVEPREGLPDWERPRTPAGKATGRHDRTPAFFAWDEEPEPAWQTQTPQKVARTLEMAEREGEPVPERSPFADDGRESATVRPLPSEQVGEQRDGMEEDMAIEVDSEDRLSEEDQPVVTGRSIAVSPVRQDILDRVPATTITVPPRNSMLPPVVEVSPASYRPLSSPRYRHGRRLLASDAAVPIVAGVTTEQADHYRMSRSSGKRFRSPVKPTSLWGDLCNSYIHQSGASNNSSKNTPSFSHKRQVGSAAERAFGGSSVFRTLNMDTYGRSRAEATRGEHQPVLSGPEAMNVAHRAAREFLGERDEESKRSEPPAQLAQFQPRSVQDNIMDRIPTAQKVASTPIAGRRSEPSNYRKGKRVSFGGSSNVHHPNENPLYPQPRTLPVLADKTTQTEDSLLPARTQTRLDASERRDGGDGSPLSCPACDTSMGESDRPRKVSRGSADSVGATAAQQRNYRRTSSHLMNPIMINPRYPPVPTTFRGKSTYSTVFNDRLAWR